MKVQVLSLISVVTCVFVSPLMASTAENACIHLFAKVPGASVRSASSEPPPMFRSRDTVKMTLQANFLAPEKYREGLRFTAGGDLRFRETEIVENESGDFKDVWEAGTLSYTLENGVPVALPMEWHTRGRSRRSQPIPPVTIRIQRDSADPLFVGLPRKMKLVPHGFDTPGDRASAASQQNQRVIREELSYRLLAALDIPAVRTRLLHLSFRDSQGRFLTEGAGIVLEPSETIEKRLGLKEKEWESEDGDEYILQKNFPVDDFTRQALAQALLGHTDWGPAYNTIQFVDPKNPSNTVLVGYDFDQTHIATAGLSESNADGHGPELFVAATFVQDNAGIQEVILWRQDQYPNEKLDFNSAFRRQAMAFVARKAQVISEVDQSAATSDAKKLILAHLNRFFQQLETVK